MRHARLIYPKPEPRVEPASPARRALGNMLCIRRGHFSHEVARLTLLQMRRQFCPFIGHLEFRIPTLL